MGVGRVDRKGSTQARDWTLAVWALGALIAVFDPRSTTWIVIRGVLGVMGLALAVVWVVALAREKRVAGVSVSGSLWDWGRTWLLPAALAVLFVASAVLLAQAAAS